MSTGGLLQPRCCTQRVLQALCKGCTGDSTVTAAHCSTAGPEFVPGFQGRFGGAWTRALVECSAGPRLGERLVQAAHLHLCCCHSLLLTTIARWRHLTAGRVVAGVSSKTCELVCMTVTPLCKCSLIQSETLAKTTGCVRSPLEARLVQHLKTGPVHASCAWALS